MKRKASKMKYGKVEVAENPFDPKTTKIKVTSWFDAELRVFLKIKISFFFPSKRQIYLRTIRSKF